MKYKIEYTKEEYEHLRQIIKMLYQEMQELKSCCQDDNATHIFLEEEEKDFIKSLFNKMQCVR